MEPGKLRHRVTFESRKTGRDEYGQPLEGWDTIAVVWASVEPISGRELLAAQQVAGEITHRIRCRYREGLAAADRAVFAGRAFDIKSIINPREIGEALEIMATEGLSDGR
jgi:SPP1 family predicted phage head-tail adaptor